MTDLQPTFSGLVMLIVYPPPPAKGGISVTNEDLHCLNDGEFLNDVIIDFYLYLVLEKLKKEDAHRIHVFSSFFYKRLNQRERRSVPDTANLIQKKKHNRVKTWTRHVDLFQKDFVFVPINEAHWYLAVICFPGLEGPVLEKNPMYVDPPPASSSPDEPQSEENIPDHDDQSSCQDECSEDGNLAEDAGVPDVSSLASKPIICKPCILIMDSLRGPSRSNVVKTLRLRVVFRYLEVEWEVRRGSQRSFGKDVMKGSSPRVPQQDNFSDCGVYVLQYVESFFELQNPIPSFQLPMNLSDWFPQQRMKTKRLEIKELILKIKDQQELDKKEAEQAEAWPGSPEEPEIEETPGPMPSIGP
uniref:SUMO specific peptidase 6a n=1 Tax=Cyprinodon variegatus TaxID=28743 RepID=A0A3Q2CIY4_CYPVA